MIAFAILATVAIFLAAVSLFPEAAWLYSSWVAVALWAALAVSSAVVIVRRRLWKRPAVFALHVALLVILAGALTTRLTGTSQTLSLEVGQSADVGGKSMTLTAFRIEYYPGTAAPCDFVADIDVDGRSHTVSMNRVATVGGRRVFLTSCNAGATGCTFTVAADAAGTAVTYTGYLLLLLAMGACLLTGGRRAVAATLLLGAASGAWAAPQALPKDLAAEFGNLYVYHAERVAPLSTLARDFTLKIYGSDTYADLTAEQVLTGWLFYYDSWKNDPGIRIRDAATRRAMGGGDRFRLNDFFGPQGYLFEDSRHAEANEKFGLVSGAAAGSLWRLFPYRADTASVTAPVEWYAPVGTLPADMAVDDWRMTRHSLSYVAELVAQSDWARAAETVRKIGRYQTMKCPAATLPSPGRIRAERIFLGCASSLWPIILLAVTGVALMIWPRPRLGRALLWLGAAWVATLMGLNWYASGHLPMGNGYETMQWMAFFALVACALLGRKRRSALAIGAVVGALALAVALMGQRNPQLTNLMPVLRSPLLSVHVLTVMLAYALLAIMALASAMWLCGRRDMLATARSLLRPAVFLLAAGIFIGAVWANMSWGRYWGWDPKEVWALITMMVYSFPLHRATLPMFRSDRVFAWWTLVSFATVIMTYVGVNFILGGLHSYA